MERRIARSVTASSKRSRGCWGPIVYTAKDAPGVLRNLRDFNPRAPDEFSGWAVLRNAPRLPFLDESVVGTDVLIVVPFYAGAVDEGERMLAPLRDFGDPVGSGLGPHPYAALQQAFNPLLTPGARNYWKSHNFRGLPGEAIDTAIEYAANVPTPLSEIFFGHVGGAMARVPADATAYPHRKVDYVMNVHTRWEDPARDGGCIAWAREFFEVMAPHAAGGSYVNFISEAEGKEGDAYGGNYGRLVALKPDLSAIKQRQRQTWTAGDFVMIGSTMDLMGELLCEAVDMHLGERVLDVATGSGNTALAAARRFCETTGVDYVGDRHRGARNSNWRRRDRGVSAPWSLRGAELRREIAPLMVRLLPAVLVAK